ncbi:MAG TPA: hypothetical protein QF468_10390 [Nitrospinota bacterium]|nr:hypothetical protein [Nitrospinota bacterium]|tara:strand:- start:379 stop:537 length:159 start_codon:yes stop_codon:yes gene_type:complete
MLRQAQHDIDIFQHDTDIYHHDSDICHHDIYVCHPEPAEGYLDYESDLSISP